VNDRAHDHTAGDTATTLPLFPLHTVLLPGARMPLHIFEPRYRQLTVDLVTEAVPERRFGVVAIRTPLIREVEHVDHVQPIGCAAVLREARRLPDGRYDIVVEGGRRFRLRGLDHQSAPYVMGEVDWIDDEPIPAGTADTAERLADIARAAHRRYCETAWHREDWTLPPRDADVAELAYLLASDSMLPVADRQSLLEETRPLHRLRAACSLLSREAGILATLRAVPAPPLELAGLAGLSKPGSLN
jgi:Lon protease-like protein